MASWDLNSAAESSVLPRLNIGPISIRYSKHIGRYPVDSVESYFHLFFLLFSPSLSLTLEELSFYLSFFFFFPSFPPLLHFFFYSNFFLPLSPCFPSLFLYIFPSVNFSIFFFFPSNQSTFITHSSITKKEPPSQNS